MQRQDFYYQLPEHLIAQYPQCPRHAARLLVCDRNLQQTVHCQKVLSVVDYLEPGDLLVVNNTKVLPARLYGQKASGGKVEILFERMLDDYKMLCHLRASKSPKLGTKIYVAEMWELTVVGRRADLFEVELNIKVLDLLKSCGHVPLPPYISRPDELSDQQNYQTIFAQHEGSVAAPTASLHFDDLLLQRLRDAGIRLGYVTLHVGAGTFKPLRVENIDDHVMHEEWFELEPKLLTEIQQTRQQGKRVIAVGTTVLRALETAAQDDFKTTQGYTHLFIKPGYQFKVINGLMTNFHLPESTLLMLVAAWIGHERLMQVYQEAIALNYRFFSYGDACLFL